MNILAAIYIGHPKLGTFVLWISNPISSHSINKQPIRCQHILRFINCHWENRESRDIYRRFSLKCKKCRVSKSSDLTSEHFSCRNNSDCGSMSEDEAKLAISCSYWLEGVLLVNIYTILFLLVGRGSTGKYIYYPVPIGWKRFYW